MISGVLLGAINPERNERVPKLRALQRMIWLTVRELPWSRALCARDQGSSRTVNRIIQIIQIIQAIILLAFQAYINSRGRRRPG